MMRPTLTIHPVGERDLGDRKMTDHFGMGDEHVFRKQHQDSVTVLLEEN